VKMQPESRIKNVGGDILHYSFYSVTQHLQQIDKFTTIMAEEKFKQGKKVYPFYHLLIKPTLFFFQRYFLRLGFLDGYGGYVVCKNGAFYKFLLYVKLRELYKENQPV